MMHVLVTGGAGNLGRHASWVLLSRGHRVRVLTHESNAVVSGVEVVAGDVVNGAGIDQAIEGVDAVIHAVAGRGRTTNNTEVVGTQNVLQAAGRIGAHFVYPSKVGVDQHRHAYYDAKWDAEGLVEDSGSKWSIARMTQFHDLIEQALSAPVFFKVPGLAFQPVDVTEVAAHLVGIVEAGPSGRVPDFGGPELLGIETLAARREQITGRRSHLVPVPRLGAMRDFASGLHLCPEHRDGLITWDQWLRRGLREAA